MSLKIALVHDYLNEFGGSGKSAFGVVRNLAGAPIFTAFAEKIRDREKI